MTEPTGGAPTPPPPQDPGSWQAPSAAPPPQFQQAPVAAGPAPGVAYADLVTRIIAMFIDGFILWIVFAILTAIVGIAALASGTALLIGLVIGLIWAAGTAVYYVYTWTTMRASPGQKVLGLETVNAADGATLTQQQAIRRWAFLWGPFALGEIIPILGLLILLAAFVYALYLLYTVSQSPKRQGFHDLQAGTVVVKRS
jgi:uncharacterized RDD family membrane protein YckC